jgi:hypothetical protein
LGRNIGAVLLPPFASDFELIISRFLESGHFPFLLFP